MPGPPVQTATTGSNSLNTANAEESGVGAGWTAGVVRTGPRGQTRDALPRRGLETDPRIAGSREDNAGQLRLSEELTDGAALRVVAGDSVIAGKAGTFGMACRVFAVVRMRFSATITTRMAKSRKKMQLFAKQRQSAKRGCHAPGQQSSDRPAHKQQTASPGICGLRWRSDHPPLSMPRAIRQEAFGENRRPGGTDERMCLACRC
jgi:hypothetical protein